MASQGTLESMTPAKHSINVPDQHAVSALHDPAEEPRTTLVFLVRRQMDEALPAHLAGLLPAMGVEVWRFVLPYLARMNNLPSNEIQANVWRAVVASVRHEGRPVIAAAEGQTGRALSELVASETLVDGLALFSYPFHAYEKPSRLRTKHFPDIDIPTLLCSKASDLEAMPVVVGEVAAAMPNATVSIVEPPAPGVYDYFVPAAGVAMAGFIDTVSAAVR
jgi:predicted alpha/beta-hydrolase family hydrolase